MMDVQIQAEGGRVTLNLKVDGRRETFSLEPNFALGIARSLSQAAKSIVLFGAGGPFADAPAPPHPWIGVSFAVDTELWFYEIWQGRELLKWDVEGHPTEEEGRTAAHRWLEEQEAHAQFAAGWDLAGEEVGVEEQGNHERRKADA